MGEIDTTQFSTAMEEFQPYADLRQKVLSELNEEGKIAFGRAAHAIFHKYPTISSFGWTQYTPYFNDGDACIFSANIEPDYGIIINEQRFEDIGWDDKGRVAEPEIPYEWFVNISNFLELVGSDMLYGLFGDHAEITVYPGRVDVSRYSHD